MSATRKSRLLGEPSARKRSVLFRTNLPALGSLFDTFRSIYLNLEVSGGTTILFR